jgi:hypothetical protein
MTTPTQNNIPSSTAIDVRYNAEKIDEVVNSDNETYQDRFGNSRFTLKGLAVQVSNFFSSLSSTTGGSKIGLSQGGTVEETLRFHTPEQITGCGLNYDPTKDDTDYIQAIIDLVTTKSTMVAGLYYQPIVIQLNRVYRITRQLKINANVVRFNGISGAGLYFDPTGNFDSNVCLLVTTNSTQAAYQGHSGSLFDTVSFTSLNRTLTLFKVVRGDSSSANNGSCLHNISKCVFYGFDKIFIHGAGGWGWNWSMSQFVNNNNLMVLTPENDTFERHSFDSCIWQGGGYAFIMNNPDGKVYWSKGSFDYCSGAAQITSGHIDIDSHMEWAARNIPFIEFLGSNASASVKGAMFIRNNSSTTYYIFKQYQEKQVKIDNLYLNTDGVNTGSGLLSNYPVVKGQIFAPLSSAKNIVYQWADSELLSGSVCSSQVTLTEQTYHSVSISNGVLTINCTGSGVSGYLYIDIPCANKEYYGFKLTASNTGTNPVYLTKFILDSNKSTIREDTSSGMTQIIGGATNTVGGTSTVLSIPPGSSFIRLRFYLGNMNSGNVFSISSIKTIIY